MTEQSSVAAALEEALISSTAGGVYAGCPYCENVHHAITPAIPRAEALERENATMRDALHYITIEPFTGDPWGIARGALDSLENGRDG